MNFLNSRAIRTQIPTAPLWLGLAGVLPFLWGAISAWNTDIFGFEYVKSRAWVDSVCGLHVGVGWMATTVRVSMKTRVELPTF